MEYVEYKLLRAIESDYNLFGLKPIPLFSGYYINSDGLVYCYKVVYRSFKLLVTFKNLRGEVIVSLRKGGVSRTFLIKRLVREVFDGVVDGRHISHWDGDKTNNSLLNLRLRNYD